VLTRNVIGCRVNIVSERDPNPNPNCGVHNGCILFNISISFVSHKIYKGFDESQKSICCILFKMDFV